MPLVCVMYLVVSGGAYGLEDAVRLAGPRLTIALCFLVPLTLSLPTALMAAELTALMPVEGGFYFWVKEAPDPFSVHGRPRRFGPRDDGPTFVLEPDELGGVDLLDLGHDDVGGLAADDRAKGRAVGHRDDVVPMGHLHRGSVGVPIDGDHLGPEPHRLDRDLAPQLSGAEQEEPGSVADDRRADPIAEGDRRRSPRTVSQGPLDLPPRRPTTLRRTAAARGC